MSIAQKVAAEETGSVQGGQDWSHDYLRDVADQQASQSGGKDEGPEVNPENPGGFLGDKWIQWFTKKTVRERTVFSISQAFCLWF